jgi:DNA-directed RNA polymerase subunit RPC12/RpoP
VPWPTPQDYNEAIQNPALNFNDPELKAGTPELTPLGLPRPIAGAFANVYHMQCQGREWAVRCFLHNVSDQQERYRAISHHLAAAKLPYTVGFDFLPTGIRVRGHWYPILKMAWVRGDTLSRYIQQHLGNPGALRRLADRWLAMMQALQQHDIAHGDLQHGNVLVVNGDFRLVDYDGMYVPALAGRRSHEVGVPHYQHPRRTNANFEPSLDNFSAWVIYLSLLVLSIDPTLWGRFHVDDEHLLFRRGDFENPGTSQVLSAIQQMQDIRVQGIAELFPSLLHLDLTEIPPLDQAATSPLGSSHPPSSEPWWKPFAAPQSAPASSAAKPGSFAGQGASWILDHVEPTSPMGFSQSVVPERISLAAFIAIVGCLPIGVLRGVVPFTDLPQVAVAGLLALSFFFICRFRFLPETIQKSRLEEEREQRIFRVRTLESNLAQLEQDKTRLAQDESREVSQLTLELSRCDSGEKREIEKIERELQEMQTRVNSQRQSLYQAETDELAQVQRNLQTAFFRADLTQYDVASATIPSIGPELKSRLLAKNIKTAADIVNVHTQQRSWRRHLHEVAYIEMPGGNRVRVEGIGPKKALALQAWRQSIEARIRSQKSSIVNQEHEIKRRYQNLLQLLHAKESHKKTEVKQKKDACHAEYQRRRDSLRSYRERIQSQFEQKHEDFDRKIHAARKELSEKQMDVERIERKLRPYEQINFPSYLRCVLFLMREKPNSNTQGFGKLHKLSVQCWRCKTQIEYTPEKRGRRARCPSCGTKQVMPVANP